MKSTTCGLIYASSIFCSVLIQNTADSFTTKTITRSRKTTTTTTWLASSSSPAAAAAATKEFKGFETKPSVEKKTKLDKNVHHHQEDDLSKLSLKQLKQLLIDLIPRMTGKQEEYRQVEAYVNALEDKYMPPQTLDFLNLAIQGDWQLLFSTTLRSGPRPNFRLRELIQKVRPSGFNGTITNVALWDLAEDKDGIFDATGTFAIKCNYSIPDGGGARMVLELDSHEIKPSRGSKIPKNIPGLFGLLHRAIPTELFDPNNHAMDTTYMDGDLKIVRMTGTKFEGVRDIFIRRGSIIIHPE